MRKIVAGLFVSLDGVVESPEKWHFPYFNEQMEQVIGTQMAAADTMLLGRVTYQEFAGYWPGSEDGIAQYMNEVRKVVVSSTLDAAEWQNSTLIRDDVAAKLTKLKRQPGKDISITGSATLVRSLLREDLLDELSLLVHPVVVGSGKRLFEHDGLQKPLELVASETFSTGVLHLTYRPA
jgi:dihydrofolate reductase